MTELEECIVTEDMKKVLGILRIFGLAPVHMTPARVLGEYGTGTVDCYRLSISKRHGVISFIFMFIIWITAVWIYIYIGFIMDPEDGIRIRKGLSLVLINLHAIFHDTILLFIAFRGLNTVKHTVSYLNNIQKLNEALHSSYVHLKIKKFNIMIWGFLISIHIIALMFIYERIVDVFIGYKNSSILLVQSIYFFTYTMQILIQLQFAFIVYLLNATIRVLSDRLQSWNSNWDYAFHNIVPSSRRHISFQRLCQIYVSICKLIRKIDKREGVFVFVLLIYKIVDILDSLYLIMSSIAYLSFGDIMPSSLASFALEVVWFIYRGATLVLLIEPCNETDKELQILKERISHLICATNKNYDREELFTFARQLVDDLPVFSPLGVICLRRQELVTVMGLLFSFLVIITQFHLRDGIGY